MNPDTSIDYYQFLGILKNNLPYPNSRENRVLLKEILDSKFRELAVKYHPDSPGGSSENFKILLRAITTLSDEKLRSEYDGVEQKSLSFQMEVDWEKYFSYTPNSLASEFGHQSASKISYLLDTTIKIQPEKKEDGYNWIFQTAFECNNLTLSLVYNEVEIMSLTDGINYQQAMPFKAHLYFPRTSLSIKQDTQKAVKVPGSNRYVILPTVTNVEYNDIILISTTNEQIFLNYIEGELRNDLDRINNNDFTNFIDQDKDTKQSLSQAQLREMDKKMLNDIYLIKLPKVVPNEEGADFLKNIKVKPISRITSKVIKLQQP